MPKSLLYFSTGVFCDNRLDVIAKSCQEIGINQLELSSGVKARDDYIDIIYGLMEKNRLLVHNYFPPPSTPFVLNLAATNKETLGLSRDHCKKAIDLCSLVNSPFYSVHSGFAIDLTPELLGRPKQQASLEKKYLIPRKVAYEIFTESISLLNDYAKKRDVGLLVENNVVTKEHVATGRGEVFLMVEATEVVQLMKDVSSKNLGILLDVGHLNVSSKALGYSRKQFFLDVKKYIGAYHVSDNNRLMDQNLPVTTDSWFWPHVEEPIIVPFILEAYNLSLSDIVNQKSLIENKLSTLFSVS